MSTGQSLVARFLNRQSLCAARLVHMPSSLWFVSSATTCRHIFQARDVSLTTHGSCNDTETDTRTLYQIQYGLDMIAESACMCKDELIVHPQWHIRLPQARAHILSKYCQPRSFNMETRVGQ